MRSPRTITSSAASACPARSRRSSPSLLSDHASFVTGADYACDGGYRALGPEGRGAAITRLMN